MDTCRERSLDSAVPATCRTLTVDGHAVPSAALLVAGGRGPARPGSHVTSAASTPLETTGPAGGSGAAPVPPSSDAALIERALTGGDDYDILTAVPSEKVEAFRAAARADGVTVTEIGRLAAGDATPQFIGPDRRPLSFEQSSYSHF